MKILLAKYLLTLIILVFLFLGITIQRVHAETQRCVDMASESTGLDISNVSITVNDGYDDSNYDKKTIFYITGEINCIPPTPNDTMINENSSAFLMVSPKIPSEGSPFATTTSLNPVVLTGFTQQTDAGFYPFNKIQFSLDPYAETGSEDEDPLVWYVSFRYSTGSLALITLSSISSLPPNTELVDNYIKITLNPEFENEEDIPKDAEHLILSCGNPVPDPDNTKTCPSDKPCCPSKCPVFTDNNNNFYCGYDASAVISPEPTPTPPLQPCQTASGKTPENCNTALGRISSDPGGFVTSILGILMSVSGMLALYFIVRSGYQIMMSRGNPEAIQEAKERLTSAIVGLLLIIFSLVILSVIGVDLLKIPGFGE